ncbi:MAG: hypothetical protein IT427_02475 [Pirellulales bacterium]|nr:hypothetical protein [Pirellulales bacterium]
MTKIKSDFQRRFDGGIRSGHGVNDSSVLHHFESGAEDFDPALLWYIDIAMDGPSLPDESGTARQWLVRHSRQIERELRKAAEHLPIGVDADDLRPFEAKRSVNADTTGVNVVSGIRGQSEGELTENLKVTPRQWQSNLNAMESLIRA